MVFIPGISGAEEGRYAPQDHIAKKVLLSAPTAWGSHPIASQPSSTPRLPSGHVKHRGSLGVSGGDGSCGWSDSQPHVRETWRMDQLVKVYDTGYDGELPNAAIATDLYRARQELRKADRHSLCGTPTPSELERPRSDPLPMRGASPASVEPPRAHSAMEMRRPGSRSGCSRPNSRLGGSRPESRVGGSRPVSRMESCNGPESRIGDGMASASLHADYQSEQAEEENEDASQAPLGGILNSIFSSSITSDGFDEDPLSRLWKGIPIPHNAAPNLRVSVAERIRWSFRYTREMVTERLDRMDRGKFSPEYENCMMLGRSALKMDNVAASTSALLKMQQQFNKSGLASVPEAFALKQDFGKPTEGGRACSHEIFLGLEALNFVRWLCRLPIVRLEGRLQKKVDFLLKVMANREVYQFGPQTGEVEERAEEFKNILSQYITGGSTGGRFALCSGIIGITPAVREFLSVVPARAAWPHYLGIPSWGELVPVLSLAPRSFSALEKYHKLFLIALNEGQEVDDTDETRHRKVQKSQQAASRSGMQSGAISERSALTSGTERSRSSCTGPVSRLRSIKVASNVKVDGSTRSLSSTAQVQRRQASIWGDVHGSVTLRRLLLNPELQLTGIARQGNKVVLWTDATDGEEGEEHLDQKKSRAETKETSKGMLSGALGVSGTATQTQETVKSSGVAPNMIERWKLKKELESDKKAARRASIQCAKRRQSVDYNQPAPSEVGLEPLVEDVAVEPLPMVCFPPPGYVPLEWVDPRAMWTIFPDPRRYQPTPFCQVHVYRVNLQLLGMTSRRLESVPLREFRVDCSQVGTPLCVAFLPDIDYYRPGDRFEVVLEGLTGENSPPEGEALSYFFILDEFRPRNQQSSNSVDACDQMQQRCIKFCERVKDPNVWTPVKGFLPAEGEHDASSGHARRNSARASRVAGMVQDSTENKACPPLGVIYYPGISKGPLSGDNEISMRVSGSEATIILLVPKHTFIRGTLAGFSKGDAKWIPLPRMVTTTAVHNEDDGPYDRTIVNVMIPMPGRFELNFKWSPVPKEIQSCRNLNAANSTHPSYDHPLCFSIQASADQSTVQLLPSLAHPLTGCIGFPPKHPLAERFGATLLAPQRYRLKIGLVHFAIHVMDDSGVYMTAEERDALLAEEEEAKRKEAAGNGARSPNGRPRRQSMMVESEGGQQSIRQKNTTIRRMSQTGSVKGAKAGGIAADDIKEACFRHGNRNYRTGGTFNGSETDIKAKDVMSNVQRAILQEMGPRTQDANVGPVSVAVVVGNWRRVEWLKPRPRLPGSAREGAEVQETVIRFSDDDQNQPVTLVVFIRRHGELELKVPSRFVLAEFLVHNAEKYPFDEGLDTTSIPVWAQ